jgi:hypothetical protein
VLVLAAQRAARWRLNLRWSVQVTDRRQALRSGVKRTSRAVPAPRTSSVPSGPAGARSGAQPAPGRYFPRESCRLSHRGTGGPFATHSVAWDVHGAVQQPQVQERPVQPVRHSPHLSRQLLPLRPRTPFATAVQLFVPCAPTSRYNSLSSCWSRATRLRRLKLQDQIFEMQGPL